MQSRGLLCSADTWGKQKTAPISGNNNGNKEDSAVVENTKVDVPQKGAGGCVVWSWRAESRPLVGILKERERARPVKRKGWNDLFFSSGLFALQEIVIWRCLQGLSGWGRGLPGPSRCTVTSHYHCFGERETEEITPKGNSVETSNLLNKWKYVTHTNNSLTFSV